MTTKDALRVLVIALALAACKEEPADGGNTTGGVGGATGGSGGVGGMSGLGGMSGGVGGSTGGVGGSTGGVGGMSGGSGGAGGMSGGAGGMSGGMGGASGGMGGMSGGAGGMSGGSGGMGGMGGGEPDAGGGEGATFTEVYAIIEAKCGGGQYGCHVDMDGDYPNDLDMTTKAMAYSSLVGVAAMTDECAGGMRVVAGNADDSFLVKAVEGTACIDQMPDGEDPLLPAEIETIRSWINAGAMND